MRSRVIELSRIAVIVLASAMSACVIGPKQDDPVAGATANDASVDTGVGEYFDSALASPDSAGDKTSDATLEDAPGVPADTSTAADTGACASDADAGCDGASSVGDAPSDSPEGG